MVSRRSCTICNRTLAPSIAHTKAMQHVAELVESRLYDAAEDSMQPVTTVRRVTDCDFLVTVKSDEGDKSVRVSVRKA